MLDISKKLYLKLIKAQSADEIAELLKTEGQDVTEAETLWDEFEYHREELKLSEDELEAVSGGWNTYDRNWAKDGCDATVEPGSRCWSHDRCASDQVTYKNEPDKHERCPQCGGYVYAFDAGVGYNAYYSYRCRKCGHEYTKYL